MPLSREYIIDSIFSQINELNLKAELNGLLGIKVSHDSDSDDLASVWDDIVLAVRLPYCETMMNWRILFNLDEIIPVPDLIFLGEDAQLKGTNSSVSQAAATLVEELYDIVRLDELESLNKWKLSRSGSLSSLCIDIKNFHRVHQLSKLSKCGIQNAMDCYKAIESCNKCEVLVTINDDKVVKIIMPLNAMVSENHRPIAPNGPFSGYLGNSIILKLKFQNRAPFLNAQVAFPPEMKVSRAVLKVPVWTPGESTLPDFAETIRNEIYVPWNRRRDLVMALASISGMLEYDAVDFGSANFYVQVPSSTSGNVGRIVRIDIGHAYPDEAPSMSTVDLLSSKHWRIDNHGLKYSPRWPASRIATELFGHACRQIVEQAV